MWRNAGHDVMNNVATLRHSVGEYPDHIAVSGEVSLEIGSLSAQGMFIASMSSLSVSSWRKPETASISFVVMAAEST